MPEIKPVTENDTQHRALARGAIEHAKRATREGDAFDLNDWLTTDVVEEAQLAWLMTGLLPNEDLLSARDVREICRAVIGRTATVLVMVGWQPPARLLDDGVSAEAHEEIEDLVHQERTADADTWYREDHQ